MAEKIVDIVKFKKSPYGTLGNIELYSGEPIIVKNGSKYELYVGTEASVNKSTSKYNLSTLVNLTDTSIVSPTYEHSLVFDATINKWVNGYPDGFKRYTSLPSVFIGNQIIYNNSVWTWNGSSYVNNTDTLDGKHLSEIVNGTTNYIPKFTGANSVGDSIIYATTDKVGIGTSNPSEKLHVDGNVKANGYKVGSGTDTKLLTDGGGTKLISDFATSAHTHDTMSGNLDMSGNSFENAGFERFTVLPTVFEGDNIVYANKVYTWNGTKYTNNENYFAETGTSDTAGRWTVNIPGITELYNGLQIKIVLKTSYDSTYNTLNINGLGQALVWWRIGSRLTSHFSTGSILNLTYYSGAGSYSTFTGGWVIDYAYYSDTVTQNNVGQFRPLAGELINYYKLGMLGIDDKFYPLTKESGTGTTKTVQTVTFKLNSPIFYCSGGNYAINTRLYTLNSMLYNGEVLYTLNQTFAAYTDLYLVGIANVDNNTFVLNNSSYTSWCTDTLPTTDNGKAYIYLGKTYSSGSFMHLFEWHPVYYYKDGALRILNTNYEAPDNILNKIKTVDGTGSGLDADLLDGNEASYFATSTHNHDGIYSTTDTKNTAGATNTSSKIYLVGSTEQTVNPQTYTHDTAYVGTDGNLYSGNSKTITTSDLETNQLYPPTLIPVWNIVKSNNSQSGIVVTTSAITLEYGYKPSATVQAKWTQPSGYDAPERSDGLCGTYNIPSQLAINTETNLAANIPYATYFDPVSPTTPSKSVVVWNIYANKKGITVSGNKLIMPAGEVSANASLSVIYQLPIYYGVVTTNSLTEAIIKALPSLLKNCSTGSKTFSPNISNTTDLQYWVYAYPSAWEVLSNISNADGDWSAAFITGLINIVSSNTLLQTEYRYYITVNRGAFKNKILNFS